MAYQKAKARKK
jgi:hypothetical protein